MSDITETANEQEDILTRLVAVCNWIRDEAIEHTEDGCEMSPAMHHWETVWSSYMTIQQQAAEIERLRADAARLDWILEHTTIDPYDAWPWIETRDDIDAAMAAEKE